MMCETLTVKTAILLCCAICFLAAFDKPSSSAGPRKRKTIDLGQGVKMEFVLIRPGKFTMGSDKGSADEKPAHQVTISKPFVSVHQNHC